MSSKRILVTGGAGFIGSHLTDRLVTAGHEVIVVDNLFTGVKRNISHHLDRRDFEFIRHDVIDPVLLEVDQIFHLACPASPVHYQANPIKTMKTNIMGTQNMLGLARRTGARFLLASTSEIYGDPLAHPQSESYWGNVNTIGPRSCYDEGKRAAETLTYCYSDQQHKVDARIVRIFNTYGPRMLFNDGRVVSNFIVQALTGQDLTVYGDGSQTRSFCYVDDLVEGILRTMNHPQGLGPWNLGNPNEMTILQAAELILDVVGSKSKVVHRPLPVDDPTRRRPDIGRAQADLGWTPGVAFREGLEKTVADFDQRLKAGEVAR